MMGNSIRMCFGYIFGGVGRRVSFNLKAMLYFKRKGCRRFAALFSNNLQRRYGVFIGINVEFDHTLKMPHPIAIIIGDGVKLGSDVVIYQNVTLGGARIGDAAKSYYPEIGDGTVIFSGAAIIGSIKIGKNCVIGANSVVTKNVPDNCTAAGVPARIIKES